MSKPRSISLLKYKIDPQADILRQVEKQIVQPNNRLIEATPLPQPVPPLPSIHEKMAAGFRVPQFASQIDDLNKH